MSKLHETIKVGTVFKVHSYSVELDPDLVPKREDGKRGNTHAAVYSAYLVTEIKESRTSLKAVRIVDAYNPESRRVGENPTTWMYNGYSYMRGGKFTVRRMHGGSSTGYCLEDSETVEQVVANDVKAIADAAAYLEKKEAAFNSKVMDFWNKHGKALWESAAPIQVCGMDCMLISGDNPEWIGNQQTQDASGNPIEVPVTIKTRWQMTVQFFPPEKRECDWHKEYRIKVLSGVRRVSRVSADHPELNRDELTTGYQQTVDGETLEEAVYSLLLSAVRQEW